MSIATKYSELRTKWQRTRKDYSGTGAVVKDPAVREDSKATTQRRKVDRVQATIYPTDRAFCKVWDSAGKTELMASEEKYVLTPNQPNCSTPIKNPGMTKPPVAP